MELYGYSFTCESDLQHHGILGQKWGVRRFQNKDGSYTTAGKSRYQRGKNYAQERSQIAKAEIERLKTANAKTIQAMQDEAYKIAKKYGLDMDDGGGGDTSRYSEIELRKAGEKYMQIWDDISTLEDQYEQNGRKYADDMIKKKYGEESISDIRHYKNTKAAVTFVAVEGAIALSVLAAIKG